MKPQDGISEAASEKRKRGRPRIMGPSAESMADFVAPDVKSSRGRQDSYYRMIALTVLTKDERLAWLADESAMKAGTGRWKPSILSELGRIPNEEDLKAVALRICELKPKTKDAVAMIRRARLGREPEGNYLTLFKHLENALNAYLSGRPSTPEDWIIKALRDLADCIEEDGLS